MVYRTILVELADGTELEPRLHVARHLAGRFDAVLIGMHVMPTPFVPAFYGEATAYLGPELLEAQRKANRENAEYSRVMFRGVCGEGANAIWQEAEGDRGQILAEAAQTADLILARRAKVGDTSAPDVLDQLVTATGVPILGMPPGSFEDFGRTIVVGWNGSREASRVAHDALPFLQAAKRVILCAVGEQAETSLEAAAAMIRRHGVNVQPHKVDEPDGNAGEVLLAQAVAHAADLLVMGAYGHTRLREMVFGGATLPVLFAN